MLVQCVKGSEANKKQLGEYVRIQTHFQKKQKSLAAKRMRKWKEASVLCFRDKLKYKIVSIQTVVILCIIFFPLLYVSWHASPSTTFHLLNPFNHWHVQLFKDMCCFYFFSFLSIFYSFWNKQLYFWDFYFIWSAFFVPWFCAVMCMFLWWCAVFYPT